MNRRSISIIVVVVITLISVGYAIHYAAMGMRLLMSEANPVTQTPPPLTSDGSVFRPVFETVDDSFCAGTTFVVRLPKVSQPVMITATHLFGPDGGMPTTIPSVKISSVVKHVWITDCFKEDESKSVVGKAIAIPEAAAMPKYSLAGDIAAFWIYPKADIHISKLSRKTPEVGQRVGLFAQVLEGAPSTQRLHAATVVGYQQDMLLYRYDDTDLDLTATSGAPVVDSDGEVVALNVGGGKSGKIGLGNPTIRFMPYLIKAARKDIPQK